MRQMLLALLLSVNDLAAQTKHVRLPATLLHGRLTATAQFASAAELTGAASTDARSVALGSSQTGIAALWQVASGRITQLGRPGPGPGEFRSASAVGFARDSVAIFDLVQRRISWFRLDGRFSSAAPSPTLAVLAAEQDGNALLGLPMTFFTASGTQRASFSIERLTPQGRTPVAPAPRPSDLTLSVRESGGSVIRLRNPAGALRDWSLSSDGRWLCEYGPLETASNAGTALQVGCRSIGGRAGAWVAGKPLLPARISRRWADSAAAAFVEGTRLPAPVESAISAALMQHGWRSPIAAIRAANDGTAWLQLADSAMRPRLARFREGSYEEWTIEPGSRLLFASATHLLLGIDTSVGETVIELWRTPR